MANVIPIHKKGSKHSVENYRPVSLLCTLSKCFEKAIFHHLFNYLQQHKIINQWQSGFTPGDSTTNQLVSMYHTFAEALDQKKDVRLVFCDVTAAFDRVWHKGLIYKMYNIGVHGNLLLWFEDYLSNRHQRVVYNGVSSHWCKINAGVPQGSVLGPLLFLIFINDLPDIVESSVRLFADDTTLFVIADDLEEATLTLNGDLYAIQVWAEQWLVSFNPQKTKTMCITNKTDLVLPTVYYKGCSVESVNTHKHLGITLTNNLTWNTHVDEICTKALRRLNLLSCLKYNLSRRALEIMYFSFIRPILEYGNILLTNCGTINNDKMEKIQIQAARIVTGAIQSTSVQRLYQETKWQTLKARREQHCLCLFYKIVNGLTPSFLSDIVPVQPQHRYNLRNLAIVPSMLCCTNRFLESFFPYTIKLWNKLPENIRQSKTLDKFKQSLTKNITKPRPWFYYGPRKESIYYARLRMKCCTLNKDMHKFGLVESPTCSCNTGVEDTFHYLFVCPKYVIERDKLQSVVLRYAPFTLHTLLEGSDQCSKMENGVIASAVITYIKNTKRFS